MAVERLDVVIIGAGISGIDAACNLRRRCPDHSFVVLERRATFGGTWDLFKYPGIRSDSDMYTFGYDFRPWNSEKPIAPKKDIRAYLEGAIHDDGLADCIRYSHHLVHAAWSSESARWTLQCANGSRIECRFLMMCGGYYDYDSGYEPDFAGSEKFIAAGGKIVHPQRWTDDVAYKNKKVVVIGSGATAITLIPSLAEEATHVTMLQRSPSYIITLPNIDETAKEAIAAGLPPAEVHRRVRDRRAHDMQTMNKSNQLTQEQINQAVIGITRMSLPEKHMSDEEFKKHFTPRYNVWEQRLCVCPDGDFFRAIRRKKASIVTEEIHCFDERGIQLKSGDRLDADLIVTATGLQLHNNPPMATMQVSVDGMPYIARDHFVYKGCMLTDVPNFINIQGYFQASWTLKADLVAQYFCRLLRQMQELGAASVWPKLPAGGMEAVEMPFKSGYVQRSKHLQPKHAGFMPWAPLFNFDLDRKYLLEGAVVDEHLHFERGPAGGANATAAHQSKL